jgi:hypothetical protein
LKFSDIIDTIRKDEVYSVNNKTIEDEMDFIANSLMEQYWKNNSATYGTAFLILVEDRIFKTDNQKFIVAAFITYLAAGKNLQADRLLSKIVHEKKDAYISMIRSNVAANIKFALWSD